tara:strand:- start:227 stop:631 length:405 start_codon:yes stop_codon:yes gene_type:complete
MNLLKLAVGIKSFNELKLKQSIRFKQHNQIIHITRLFPKKFELIKNRGSMYWIINGYISVRQKIINLEKVKHEDGKNYCHIILDQRLVETRQIRYRAFQGWRYLRPENTPEDIQGEKYKSNSQLYKILEDLCLI